MNVGVAGLGNMGSAVAARLIETGNTVTAWNRSADKCKPLAAAGAKVAPSAAALAAGADVVITILTDASAITAVYAGPTGLLAGNVAGKLFVEMSTVPPDVETELAEQVRAKGAAFVECPVGGTTGPARQGKLIGLMGADPVAAARAMPLLTQLCRRIEHCGPVGAGATMKLAINLPLMVYWQALGEALALARPLGLDPARMIELLADSSGGANVLKVRGPALVRLLNGEDPGPAMFTLDNGIKDLRLMLAEGASRGIDMPLVAGALACFAEASRQGLGASEAAGMSVYWSTRAGGKLNLNKVGGGTMPVTLAQASTIVDVALNKARQMNLAPLTVAVLDSGGHLVAFKREDNSGILRYDIAYGKAWGALGMGFGSRTLFERAANTPQFFNALYAASGGRVVTNPGGVLIRDAGGDIIGAVGVSGDTSDNDEVCAIAGIEAASLKGDPGGR